MKQPTISIFQVDAFTSQPFSGNPAAVCLLEKPMSESWMQSVAAEMNLSETAFVQRQENGFSLRWFTPTIEVNLCGHATLATAHILWQKNWLAPGDEAVFQTKSGQLIARQSNDEIILDFPKGIADPTTEPKGLLKALGLKNGEIFFDSNDYLIQIEKEQKLHDLKPNFLALAKIKTRGVMVTTLSTKPEYDFISRFFGPAAGINEDPVTGSAHCTLATFWAERLGKTKMIAYQASRRGGEIGVELMGDRVLLCGKAITVLQGELNV